MNTNEAWSIGVSALALAIPTTFALAAVALPPRLRSERAPLVGVLALGLALLFAVGAALGRGAAATEPMRSFGVRVDAITSVMLLLVCGIGAVIARYSERSLRGDPGLARYSRWLLLTLCTVTILVTANNLLAVAAAWTATSLALHQLLTFYPDRTAALVAAHKKFLISRLADVSLWSCLALIQLNVNSLNLDRISNWAAVHPGLTPSMQVAAVLVVIAVVLKSAQLPFHGWLTQVMEAPTPVSALLHAGIVNIGGFLMIRLSPLMVHAPLAQSLLVVVGLVTTILAALVMTTRVSVKVALAWSTCAQMGFMLVQCGLYAWHLALLHLVAHSLYKAHAFLNSGTAVDDWRRHSRPQRLSPPSWWRLSVTAVVTVGGALLVSRILQYLSGSRGGLSVDVLALMVSLSFVPTFVRQGEAGATAILGVIARGLALGALCVAWHSVATRLVPAHSLGPSSEFGVVVVGAGFVGLFGIQMMLQLHPQGRFSRGLYPWLFAGLYLDEYFTRLTFRLWPPRLPRAEKLRPRARHQTLVHSP